MSCDVLEAERPFMCSLSLSLFFLTRSPSPRPLCPDVPDRKLTSDEEEARRIAEMGKPVLGEHSKMEVIIEESYEFKVRKLSLMSAKPTLEHFCVIHLHPLLPRLKTLPPHWSLATALSCGGSGVLLSECSSL